MNGLRSYPEERTYMYMPMPASHNGLRYSFFLSLLGCACVRMWSIFVIFSPNALRAEAETTITTPIRVFYMSARTNVA